MEIILDVDEVAADLVQAICDIAGRDKEEAVIWDFFEEWPDRERIKVYRAFREPDWWESLPKVEKAIKGVSYLRNQGHTLIWCTAPFTDCFGWVDARRKWLNENFKMDLHGDKYIPTWDKEYVQGDVFIDDRVNFIKKWRANNPNGIAYLFTSTLNKGHDTQYRINNWQDIIDDPFFRRVNV